MPCGAEHHRLKTGLFCAILIKILGRKALKAARQVRGLRINSFAAMLSVSTLLMLLIIGGIECNPGPKSESSDGKNASRNTPKDKVSETDKILTAISEIKTSQNELSTTVSNKLEVMEQSINSSLEDIRSTQAAIYGDIEELNNICGDLSQENEHLRDRIEDLEEKVDYLENQSRRNNLLIHGLPQSGINETWEETEEKVKDLFKNLLKISASLQIERAHRMGKAIVVKFLSFKDRDLVLSKARMLKDAVPKIFIRPDVSATVRQKINGLLDLKKSYHERNQRAVIKHDKLVTADGVFTFNLKTQTIETLTNRRKYAQKSESNNRQDRGHAYGEDKQNSSPYARTQQSQQQADSYADVTGRKSVNRLQEVQQTTRRDGRSRVTGHRLSGGRPKDSHSRKESSSFDNQRFRDSPAAGQEWC